MGWFALSNLFFSRARFLSGLDHGFFSDTRVILGFSRVFPSEHIGCVCAWNKECLEIDRLDS